MIYPYKGHFNYEDSVIRNWDSEAIGVYYCGYLDNVGNLWPLYIGKGVGEDGIRGRLLAHLRDDNWSDISHFGYHLCSSITEAEKLEAEEIAKYKPRHNTQGK